jgi:hypothetical protein
MLFGILRIFVIAATVLGVVYFYNNTKWFQQQFLSITNDLFVMVDSDQRQLVNNTKHLNQLQSMVDQLYKRQEKTLHMVQQVVDVLEDDHADTQQEAFWIQPDVDVPDRMEDGVPASDDSHVSSGSDDTQVSSGSDDTQVSNGSDDTQVSNGSDDTQVSSGSDDTQGSSGSSGSDDTQGSSGSDDTQGSSGSSGSSGSDDTQGSSSSESATDREEQGGVEEDVMMTADTDIPVQPDYTFTRAELNRLRRDTLLLVGKQHGLEFGTNDSLHYMRTSIWNTTPR